MLRPWGCAPETDCRATSGRWLRTPWSATLSIPKHLRRSSSTRSAMAVVMSPVATCTPVRSTRSWLSSPQSRSRRVSRVRHPEPLPQRSSSITESCSHPEMAHVPAERCLGIIELLADGARAMPLGEIADRLALPKSGAHRLLATLVDLGWAEQDPETGFYRLTMRLAVLGQRFYVASGVPDICQPLLDRFACDCREFARLAVVDGNSLVWIAHAQGATGGLLYQPADTTGTVPLYATASGKAWLATLRSDEAVHNVMRNGGFNHADRYGPNVIRSIEALLRDLPTTTRRRD